MSVINLAHPQAKGLVLLHDYATDPRASDLSGNKNNGNLVNSPDIVGGKFGNALSLNGSTQGITVSESTSLDITGNEISLGAWVYPTASSSYQMLVGKDVSASSRQYAIYLTENNTSRLYVALSGVTPGNVGRNYDLSIPWVVNKWNHVFVTYKSGVGGAIYINGRVAYSSGWTGTISHLASNVHIGFEGSDNTYYVSGRISEARIYNRWLSEAEVLDLYTNPRALFDNDRKSIYLLSALGGSGATIHATNGALSNSGATIAGTAAHIAKHATTGVLANSGASIAGSASNFTAHATSGTLSNSGAAIAGSALNFTPHATSGVLANSGATLSGTADHVAAGGEHATSGSLSAGGATIAGTSAHIAKHATSGVLATSGAVIAGSALNFTVHGATGALSNAGAVIAGSALHSFAITHETSGALAGWGAEITGSALNGTVVEEEHFSGGYFEKPAKPRKKRKKIYEIDQATGNKTAYSVLDDSDSVPENNPIGIETTLIIIDNEEETRRLRYKILAAAALLS